MPFSMSRQYEVMLWMLWASFLSRGGRLKVAGRENLPVGPYIIATNHLSNWDPVVAGLAMMHTQIHPLGKQELFDIPILGKLPPWLGGIPVRRGAVERETIDQARTVLAQGRPLLVLPEGTRSRTGGLGFAKPGLIFLAQLTKAPIVPLAIWGTERMRMGWPWKPTEIQAHFGRPISVARSRRGSEREAALDEVMVALARLLPVQYRGVYAEAAQAAPPIPVVPEMGDAMRG